MILKNWESDHNLSNLDVISNKTKSNESITDSDSFQNIFLSEEPTCNYKNKDFEYLPKLDNFVDTAEDNQLSEYVPTFFTKSKNIENKSCSNTNENIENEITEFSQDEKIFLESDVVVDEKCDTIESEKEENKKQGKNKLYLPLHLMTNSKAFKSANIRSDADNLMESLLRSETETNIISLDSTIESNEYQNHHSSSDSNNNDYVDSYFETVSAKDDEERNKEFINRCNSGKYPDKYTEMLKKILISESDKIIE